MLAFDGDPREGFPTGTGPRPGSYCPPRRRRRRTGLTKAQMDAILFLKAQGVTARDAASIVIMRGLK